MLRRRGGGLHLAVKLNCSLVRRAVGLPSLRRSSYENESFALFTTLGSTRKLPNDALHLVDAISV